MLPIGFETKTWYKFSKYEIYEDKKGIYIIPAKDSDKIMYDPLSISRTLLDDYLRFGKAIYEGMHENRKNMVAYNLVKKYGLLGIYTFPQYKLEFRYLKYPEFSSYLWTDDSELVSEKSFSEIISEFFPLPDRQPPFDIQYSTFEKGSNIVLQFERNYSEKVEWISKKAYRLYESFKNIENLKKVTEIENLSNNDYFDKVLSCRLKIKNVDITIQYDEVNGVSLNWSANNLSKMIDIMYSMERIDKKNGFSFCKNCGDIYEKTRQNKEYCTEECGNSFRVKKCIKNKEHSCKENK